MLIMELYCSLATLCKQQQSHKKKHKSARVCGWENSFDGKTLIFPGRRVSAEISQTSEITGAQRVHAQNNYRASLGLLQSRQEAQAGTAHFMAVQITIRTIKNAFE